MRRPNRSAALALCVAATAATIAGCAAEPPAPPAPVSGEVIAQGVSSGTVAAENPGATDVVVRRIVIQPGASTGWHHHTGELIAVVQSGTLSRQLADCSVVTSSAGQSFVEPAGADKVHIGSNLGTEPVVLYVTYLIPAGDLLAVPETAASCQR